MVVAEVPIGAVVIVKKAGRGTVRFDGTAKFATGRWVGIELDGPRGKNDGSVEGWPYFTCRPNYGVFVRITQIESVESLPPSSSLVPNPPTPARPTHKVNGSISAVPSSPVISRANSSSMRSVDSSRAASPHKPSPQAGASRARPVPQTTLRAVPMSPAPSSSTFKAPQTPTARAVSVQQKLAQLPSRRGSIPPPMTSSPASKTLTPSSIPSALPRSPRLNTASVSPAEPSESQEIEVPEDLDHVSPVLKPVSDDSRELRVKLRVLETKRDDDARRIRELENRLSEAEAFVSVRPKLQAKLQSLHTENLALKRSVADHTTNIANLERKMEEQGEDMEMLMLDKEMAEERAEGAEAELEGEKEAKAELEVELEVWRKGGATAEGAEGDEDGKGARSELAFRQMEKQNERLKEALMRLRDLAHETDAEQRRRIADLEKELAGVDDMQAQYAQTLARLEHADLQVEDLKQQLDDALGAEEILVQLTERNLLMGEKIEEMRIAIEDLEALRELNDELEETHVETERSLQEEVEQREAECRELQRKVELLQEGLQDYEITVQQFRDLVNNLQSELDGLREQDQTRQTESQAQASQSAALMSLNMRLQSSAAKNQAKNIEIELKRLDAAQSKEMLSIVQPYLPQAYMDSDSDPTNCYMFFQRIAFKMDLINTVVASQHGLPDSLGGPIQERLVGVCDMRGRIAHLSALCKRFAAVLRYCEPELFLNAGRIYPDLAPLEKRADMHIDLLRREEFREVECLSDVAKMLLQFEHLNDSYFTVNAELDVGERELDLASQIDCDLDTFFATLGLAKTALISATSDDDVQLDVGDLDLDATLLGPLQGLLDSCKAPRLASKKILKRVEELVASASAVSTKVVPEWTSMADNISKLVGFGIPLAQSIATYVSDVRSQKHAFDLPAVLSLVRQTVNETFGNKGSPWTVVEQEIAAVNQEFVGLMPFIMEPENVIHVSGVSPWITRVEEIKAIAAVNLDAERAVLKLNDEILMLVKGVKTRDQTIQESAAKIELMERRMEAVKAQADAITELESQLAKSNQQEKTYSEAIEALNADMAALDRECSRLKQQLANAPERSVAGIQPSGEDAPTVAGDYETSHMLEQIDNLRGTIRFLREENSYLKGQDLLKELNSLPEITTYIPSTPPLSPSTSLSPPSSPDGEDSKPTVRSLQTESKMLFRDVIHYSSSIRVVDMSMLNDGKNKRKPWVSQKQSPAGQLWEQKMEGEKLARRVRGLVERAGTLRR